jgi:protein phosphatase
MKLVGGWSSDVGNVRDNNQDVALHSGNLFAVADGMGGHVGGEVAARLAVEVLEEKFQKIPTLEGLREAVIAANEKVYEHSLTNDALRGMGTTLTATALVEEAEGRSAVGLVNVGDSRAYLYAEGQLQQITADHSLAEERVRHGQLTEEEAAVHPHRHILTRALGVAPDVDVDLWELHVQVGDRLLLCSDGLTNEVETTEIAQILGKHADPVTASTALVAQALTNGGSDNVTVVVIDVEDDKPTRRGASAKKNKDIADAKPHHTHRVRRSLAHFENI